MSTPKCTHLLPKVPQVCETSLLVRLMGVPRMGGSPLARLMGVPPSFFRQVVATTLQWFPIPSLPLALVTTDTDAPAAPRSGRATVGRAPVFRGIRIPWSASLKCKSE